MTNYPTNTTLTSRLSSYLTTAAATTTYQPIGTYLTSSSLTNYLTTTAAASTYQTIANVTSLLLNYITSSVLTSTLANYITSSSLANSITTQSIYLGAGGAIQIYDTQNINIQTGAITSLIGMIQHSTELDFIISSNYSSPPASAYILKLTSSNAQINGTLTAGTISLYTLTGATNPGVIQHATGLLFCISSTNPVSAAADKLMSLDNRAD